ILSLAIGFTVFAICFVYVQTQFEYNRSWPEANKIHRLVVEYKGIPGMQDQARVQHDLTTQVKIQNYFGPEIEEITRLFEITATIVEPGVSVAAAKDRTATRIAFVDPSFPTIFGVETVAGDLRRAMTEPRMIALEESFATSL